MTIAYKVLGQACPATTGTLTTLYMVPAGTQTVISSLAVTDVGNNGGAFSMAIAVDGAADTPSQYLYGNQTVGFSVDALDTFIATIGLTLNAGDVVGVRNIGAHNSELTFQLFGSEITA